MTEDEAIQILIDEVGLNKMKVLASDIFSHGLNPHRQPIAVLNENGTYNIYDGNRRISVIKCVLWKDTRFKKIENKIDLTLDTEILVYVTDVEEALRLIEVEHTGEAGGRGQIPWEAFQRDYAFRQNHKQAIYPYAYEVSKICNLNRKSDFRKIPYTDLDTIFKNEIVKEIFGVDDEWDFTNVDFIKSTYQKLRDAKTRGPYSRYLPRLKSEKELEEFKQLLFPNTEHHATPQLVLPSAVEAKQYGDDFEPKKVFLPSISNQADTTSDAVEQSGPITYTSTPGSEKRKNNRYKVNPALLFQWRGKGINIDHAVFKPTLEFAIGLQINTDMELRRIAAYLYRLLLEIALRYWCIWYQANEGAFNTGSIANYNKTRDCLFGTTSTEVSFISENKINHVIQVLESIKHPAKNHMIRDCFKGRSVQSYCDMIRELNNIIHGSKEHIDKTTLEKYDDMVLKYLVALSISLNDPI
ncbi:hypothetical protein RWV98_06610 [Agathobaculum sp. NTUH-O15-33]|uniref:hypothetical protein n=1 Tax=Agathobaculum sp. NTUH-O15-33 TaxID=3079302 RepID=UPI0029585892|nr:hypothetical protein [Agathobaculum sp. NTUH-O15-33]WNX85934.1 hypothetical protein RWV98_06610 [Agathobaculum sp. NTUH-O15-33]